MNSTQEDIPISEIKEGVIRLKSGDMALIIKTSAVNFGLLSQNEQIAIIAAFAGMLNSLSFPIQILIRSKRLDISSYLAKLDLVQKQQTNPLLFNMISRYKNFIARIIKENEVLDKLFFVVIPLWSYEISLLPSSPQHLKKALTVLIPRRDHLIRQLSGIGLQAQPLQDEELLALFFDIYNSGLKETFTESVKTQQAATAAQLVSVQPEPIQPIQTSPAPSTFQTIPQPASQTPSAPKQQSPVSYAPSQPVNVAKALSPGQRIINPKTPFIVEELSDEYGTI